jgi:hypothetical protein
VDEKVSGSFLEYEGPINTYRLTKLAVDAVQTAIKAFTARVHEFMQRPCNERFEFEPYA